MDPRDSGPNPSSHLLGSPPGDLLLRLIPPDGQPKVIRTAAVKCTVGSAPSCTIRLPRAGVEPVHCVILRGNRQTLVRCWSEQTRLNGQRFTEAPLVLGDRLGVGPIELEVVSDNTSQSTPLASVRLARAPTPGDAELDGAHLELARRALDLQEKARQLELSHESLRQQREVWFQTQSSLESETAARIEQMNDKMDHLQQRSLEQQARYDRLTQQLAEAIQARDAAIGERAHAREPHKAHPPQQKKLSLRQLAQPSAALDQPVRGEPQRRVRRRLSQQFEPGKAETLPHRKSAKPPPEQSKRELITKCQQLTRRVQPLEAICHDHETPMRSRSNKSKGAAAPAKSAPEKTDATELQRRMRDRLTQQFEPANAPTQTAPEQVESPRQARKKRRGRRDKMARPESQPVAETSSQPEPLTTQSQPQPSAPSPSADESRQDFERLHQELEAQRAVLESHQKAWEQERREIEMQLTKQSQQLCREHESVRQEQKTLRQEQETLRQEQETLRQEQATLRQDQKTFQQAQETLQQEQGTFRKDRETFRHEQKTFGQLQEAFRRERKAFEQETEWRAEQKAQQVERVAEERCASEEERSGGERRLDQLVTSLTSQPDDVSPYEQQNPVQTPKKDAPVSVMDLLAKRQDMAEVRSPESDHHASPTKRNIDVRSSASEDRDEDEHDASVQEYLNNLLQRSGGQIIPTPTVSHKSKLPSELAEEKSLPQLSQTPEEPPSTDREPVAPEEYRPRSAPPELASDFAAMRALANQMARGAIDRSRQSRWLQAVIFKVMIAGGALVATILFGRLSERLFSLEFLTAGGAAVVAILFALEALVLGNQIRVVSRRTKMQKADRANPRAGYQLDRGSDEHDHVDGNPQWASLWEARQRKAGGGTD
jgi:hypothetical protein